MSDDGINGGRSPAMEALATVMLGSDPQTVIFDEVAGVDPAPFDKLAERIRQGGWKRGELISITGGMRLGKTDMIRKLLDKREQRVIVLGPSEWSYDQWLSKMNASQRLEVREFTAALQQANVPVPEEIDTPPKKPIRHGPQAVRKGKVKRW